MRHSYFFFAMMAAASAVSIVKMAVLASLFSPSDFARYASLFAIAGLASSLLSFGLVEATAKRYTRLIAFGRHGETSFELRAVLRTLCLRSGVALILIIPVAAVIKGTAGTLALFSILLFSLSANLFSLTGSVLRGLDRLAVLGASSLARVLLATGVVSAFGVAFGWQAGIVSEAMTSAVLGFLMACYSMSLLRQALAPKSRSGLRTEEISTKQDGLWLFFASLLALVPMSLDRWWILAFDAPGIAASYAFCAIWFGGAYTVSSIYIQKFGPEIIRSQALGATGRSVIRMALKHTAGLTLFVVIGTIASLIAVRFVFFDVYWLKYGLSVPTALLLLAGAAAQCTPIFDWTLISLNGERCVLIGATIFTVVTSSMFMATSMLEWGLNGYLVAFLSGRLVQFVGQVYGVRQLTA